MHLLENNLQHLSHLLEALPGNYLILKPDTPRFTIVAVTDNYNKVTFTKREEIIGKGIFEVFPDSPQNNNAIGAKNLSASLHFVLQQKKEEYLDDHRYDPYNPQIKQFEVKYWRVQNKPVLDETGEVLYIIHSAVDRTELVKLEKAERAAQEALVQNARELEQKVQERTKALTEANEKLQKTNKKLEEFNYVASHDLQEPLRKIATFASLIEEREKDNLSGQGKRMLEGIVAAAKRMKLLITDLFTLSQVTSYKESFEKVDLNHVLQKVKEDISLDIEGSGAVIEAEDLGCIIGIPRQLEQLFQNLIGNAIKYSRKEERPLIRIRSETVVMQEEPIDHLVPHTSYGKLTFKDNGIGFDEEYAEKIFQLFYRLHGKTEYPGTGIGLAICKKIAENHKGTIIAKGEEGRGAQFEVYLKC